MENSILRYILGNNLTKVNTYRNPRNKFSDLNFDLRARLWARNDPDLRLKTLFAEKLN